MKVNSLHAVATALESKVESVEEFEEMVRNFARDAGFDEDDQYFMGLAAREIVINAIKHGNRFDPAKKVNIRLSKDADRMSIEVSDEGAGFRLEDVPDPHAPENQHRRSGRGLAMSLAIMDEFAVEKNHPHGVRIRMGKSLKKSA
jgi:serine/threonine-protein kinase RsbW